MLLCSAVNKKAVSPFVSIEVSATHVSSHHAHFNNIVAVGGSGGDSVGIKVGGNDALSETWTAFLVCAYIDQNLLKFYTDLPWINVIKIE